MSCIEFLTVIIHALEFCISTYFCAVQSVVWDVVTRHSSLVTLSVWPNPAKPTSEIPGTVQAVQAVHCTAGGFVPTRRCLSLPFVILPPLHSEMVSCGFLFPILKNLQIVAEFHGWTSSSSQLNLKIGLWSHMGVGPDTHRFWEVLRANVADLAWPCETGGHTNDEQWWTMMNIEDGRKIERWTKNDVLNNPSSLRKATTCCEWPMGRRTMWTWQQLSTHVNICQHHSRSESFAVATVGLWTGHYYLLWRSVCVNFTAVHGNHLEPPHRVSSCFDNCACWSLYAVVSLDVCIHDTSWTLFWTLLWTSMSHYEYLWISMNTYEYLWIPISYLIKNDKSVTFGICFFCTACTACTALGSTVRSSAGCLGCLGCRATAERMSNFSFSKRSASCSHSAFESAESAEIPTFFVKKLKIQNDKNQKNNIYIYICLIV